MKRNKSRYAARLYATAKRFGFVTEFKKTRKAIKDIYGKELAGLCLRMWFNGVKFGMRHKGRRNPTKEKKR